MICPICGTQQRAAERCVQCHTPISEDKRNNEAEDPLASPDPASEDSFDTVVPASESILAGVKKNPGPRVPREVSAAHATYPSISSQDDQRPPASDFQKSAIKKPQKSILVSTTQRVEGKRIGKYLGLVQANLVVDLSDLSISPTGIEYQAQFKRGTLEALGLLKAEAALVGANAVVAASFDFHRIDTQIILLSAVGTAVVLEGPKAN